MAGVRAAYGRVVGDGGRDESSLPHVDRIRESATRRCRFARPLGSNKSRGALSCASRRPPPGDDSYRAPEDAGEGGGKVGLWAWEAVRKGATGTGGVERVAGAAMGARSAMGVTMSMQPAVWGSSLVHI